MGNKKHRFMFFYDCDAEHFKKAWRKSRGEDFDSFIENFQQEVDGISALGDRIAVQEAENAKGLDFPPPEEKAGGEERPERFTDVCRSMGITADWARKNGAPRFKFGKAYYALRSRMEKWQRELAEMKQ